MNLLEKKKKKLKTRRDGHDGLCLQSHSTWEARGPEVLGQPGLHVKPCSQANKQQTES
jgi:hypothetical protein